MFVGMQTTYILWTWLIEGRPRATISTLFMFTFRGILGYSTQLPLPQVIDHSVSTKTKLRHKFLVIVFSVFESKFLLDILPN